MCMESQVSILSQNHLPITFIENISSGILMEIGRGTITSVRGIGKYNIDMIPVDVVCNTMINAAWANSFMRTSEIPVYNCTSGQLNPFKWHELADGIKKYARKNPTKYVMMYPDYTYRTNLFVHWLYEIFLHYLPSIIFDCMLRMQGKKAFMFKIAKRFKLAADVGTYFAMHEWNFETKNIRRLMRAARETQLDAHEFNCDLSGMDWDAYMEKYMMGIRTFVLKDDVSSLPQARKRLQRIVWTKRIIQFILFVAFHYVMFFGFWN
jgi:alcohol-forming fatty acyl-CoA reductase